MLSDTVDRLHRHPSLFLQMTVRDALNSAIDEEMAADPKVFVIGEEVSTVTVSYWQSRLTGKPIVSALAKAEVVPGPSVVFHGSQERDHSSLKIFKERAACPLHACSHLVS